MYYKERHVSCGSLVRMYWLQMPLLTIIVGTIETPDMRSFQLGLKEKGLNCHMSNRKQFILNDLQLEGPKLFFPKIISMETCSG